MHSNEKGYSRSSFNPSSSGIKKPGSAASGEIIYKICVNNCFVCDLPHIDNMLAGRNFI
jgi:hypothetical protein